MNCDYSSCFLQIPRSASMPAMRSLVRNASPSRASSILSILERVNVGRWV